MTPSNPTLPSLPTARVDLFTPVHKALRALLFAAAQQSARADFSHPADAARAAEAVARALEFVEAHARHEDAEILPALAAAAPALAADLAADHARIHGLTLTLAAQTSRLEGASEAERISLGRRLNHRLHLLIADTLRHFEREEVEVQRVLCANLGDAELAASRRRIHGAIPPSRRAEWLALMVPAVSAPEREALLAGPVGAAEGAAPRTEGRPW